METEQVTEYTNNSQDASEEPISENKSRGRGFKGHAQGGPRVGRGGRMGRGFRGGRGMMMKGFGPPGRGRGRGGRDGVMNGFGPMRGLMRGPMRRGMGRMRPYPDIIRGRRGGRGGPMGMGPPPPPPPPMHMRCPFPPMHRHGPPPPPPLGHPGFRGRPPHPRGRGMPPGPPRHFHLRGPRGPRGPRGYHNGPASPPHHPPPGRGQSWPWPPGGRRF